MEFCPNLDMTGGYLAKALQGSQFCCFRHIIFGIHEDDISSYNAYIIALLEDQNIKLEK